MFPSIDRMISKEIQNAKRELPKTDEEKYSFQSIAHDALKDVGLTDDEADRAIEDLYI